MFGRSAVSRALSAFVFAAGASVSSANKKWTIEDNIHHSYFNIDGDQSEELPKGTVIRLNNVNYNIIISMASEGHTFIQLDKEHNAEPGDSFIVVEDESDLGVKSDSGVDLDDGEEESVKKPQEVKTKPGEFSEDIVEMFSENVDVADVTEEVKAKQKPGLVFVTQPWCGACKNLKTQVSKSASAKSLMEKFVVVHASEDDGQQWQAEGEDDGYIPRVYFLGKDGKMTDILGPNEEYTHFFGNAADLEKAMKKALAADSGSSSSSSHASDEL